jgi:peptide/nickel transport system substrate-binding protein
LRFDPVQGLFGLAIIGKSAFLASPEVRAALAMAIDRNAMATAIGIPGWSLANTVLPAQLDSAQSPAQPAWGNTSLVQRRDDAAARIANWRGGAPAMAPLRVALPHGPGMRIFFARLSADWRAIGVRAIAVPFGDPSADLRLIDAVAPNSSANWYFTRLSCAAGLSCDSRGDDALAASRMAPTLADRSARLADADNVMASRGSYIPIGVPIRWSLVDPALTGWKENVFGAHPLTELRPAPAGG